MKQFTLDDIRKLLRPKQVIVFCSEEDEAGMAEGCQRLRDEGHKIAHKTRQWIEPGTAYAVDVDLLQPYRGPITWDA